MLPKSKLEWKLLCPEVAARQGVERQHRQSRNEEPNMTQDKTQRGLTAGQSRRRRVHRVTAALVPLLFMLGSVHATQSGLPVAVGPTPEAWSELDPIVAGRAIQRAESLLATLPDEHRDALQSLYDDAGDVASWLPGLYDAFVDAVEQQQDGLSSESSSSQSTLSELLDGLLTLDADENPLVTTQYWDTVFTVTDGILQSQGGAGKIEMARDMVIGVFGGDGQKEYRYPYPFPACPPMGPLVENLIGEDPCTYVGIIGFVIAVALAVVLGPTGLDPFSGPGARSVGQRDGDRDGVGDAWAATWSQAVTTVLDYDGDGLLLVDEFRWQRFPTCFDTEACLPPYQGDDWSDGAEVAYWNNDDNDDLSVPDSAFFDPDRTLDSDADGAWNVNETDSDDDGLSDGLEIALGTYPEFPDSDCDASAVACTSSTDSGNYWDQSRFGNPGKGDGINDRAEQQAWDALGAGLRNIDHDGDGIANNLLDPDADGDGLLDGEEFLFWHTKPHRLDSDLDGLNDGEEVRIYRTNPALWDSDGDGMPDGWETSKNLNPLANDAALDPDADALSNLGEYVYARPSVWNEATQGPWMGGTNPVDADTEGDALLDGDEVLTQHTNPFTWDTDLDGMADWFEATYALDPLNATDAGVDFDADSFDQGNDGSIQQAWPNVAEYRYGRPGSPAAWSEVEQGPWQFGTDPLNLDTDGDGAGDGMEAYFGTNARIAADVGADDDQDGLTWADEANLGTNPSDADTDGDGLCDGGRAAACTWPGGDGTGFQPGESDYGSIPWDTDSDSDGRDDGWEALKWDHGATGTAQDVDGDFLNGVIDSDSDNDGLTDGDEFTRTTDMTLADTDGDTLLDGDEVNYYGTLPKVADSDGDGLRDDEEFQTPKTDPRDADSDDDGLDDFEEVRIHLTNPNWWDTDHDGLPDAWEVAMATAPQRDDAGLDADGDGLVHLEEYEANSHPFMADTDGDGLPDGYEVGNGLAPWWSGDAGLDADADFLSNLEEFQQDTLVWDPDTDEDGLMDGDEALNNKGQEIGTHPLVFDTDGDHLGDGAELEGISVTIHLQSGTTTYVASTNPLSPDTDGDGAEDGSEFTQWKTDPSKVDSDGDGLPDEEEANEFQGTYSPIMWDTNEDGESDGLEEALICTSCDDDRDGLTNNDEHTKYNTDVFDGDSDNDGICDGSERNYWGSHRWNQDSDWDGIINLLDGDSDNDGLSDGFEVGQGAYPNVAGGYKTNPLHADTDQDMLGDALEERLVEDVDCPLNNDGSSMSSMSSSSSTGFGLPGLGEIWSVVSPPGLPGVGLGPLTILEGPVGAEVLTGLAWNEVVRDVEHGVLVGFDEKGPYVQGAFGVRLRGFQFPDGTQYGIDSATGLPELVPTQSMSASSSEDCPKGKPTLKNSDNGLAVSDRLDDNTEVAYCLDPQSGDTDKDSIRDDLDGGDRWSEDTDGDGKINPADTDSDNDGLLDAAEDKDRNGRYSASDLGDPLDADTDDDGILDGNEAAFDTLLDVADSDKDGLSDGLEVGLSTPQVDVLGNAWTQLDRGLVQCGSTWIRNTWQPFQGTNGITTSQGDADSDNDGILDGLEDLNHNGVFGDNGELKPNVADTDGDNLMDGLELLLYGDTNENGEFTYGLCEIHEVWGSESNWESRMEYDSTNIFQTNPRSAHTDAGTDTVPDGKDLSPTGDALMSFGFGAYRQVDPIDPAADCAWNWCGGPDKHKWQVDLSISVTLETPAGTYSFATEEITDWYTRNERNFNNLPSDETLALIDEQTKPTAVAGRFDVVGQAVSLNLPDSVEDLSNSGSQIVVTIGAVDDDGALNGEDDTIDINPKPNDGTFVETIDLMSGPKSGKGLTGWMFDANGGTDNVGSDDGQFKATLGSNVMPYFLSNALALKGTNGELAPPSGTCLAGSTTGGHPCVK